MLRTSAITPEMPFVNFWKGQKCGHSTHHVPDHWNLIAGFKVLLSWIKEQIECQITWLYTLARVNRHASLIHSVFRMFAFTLVCISMLWKAEISSNIMQTLFKILQFVHINLAVLPLFRLCSTVLSVIAPTSKRRNSRYTLDRWIQKCITDFNVSFCFTCYLFMICSSNLAELPSPHNILCDGFYAWYCTISLPSFFFPSLPSMESVKYIPCLC